MSLNSFNRSFFMSGNVSSANMRDLTACTK